MQSLGWQPTLCVAWCLIWWFASLDIKVWSYMTPNVLTETRCHNNPNPNPNPKKRLLLHSKISNRMILLWFQPQNVKYLDTSGETFTPLREETTLILWSTMFRSRLNTWMPSVISIKSTTTQLMLRAALMLRYCSLIGKYDYHDWHLSYLGIGCAKKI